MTDSCLREQICAACSRTLVQEKIAPEFLKVSRIRDKTCRMGVSGHNRILKHTLT